MLLKRFIFGKVRLAAGAIRRLSLAEEKKKYQIGNGKIKKVERPLVKERTYYIFKSKEFGLPNVSDTFQTIRQVNELEKLMPSNS